MSINGRADHPRAPGFFVSMAGISEIVVAIAAALFLDDLLEIPDLIGGLSVGQFIALVMAVGGVVVFLVGRRMGWQARGDTGSIGKSGSNSNNNPVRRM